VVFAVVVIVISYLRVQEQEQLQWLSGTRLPGPKMHYQKYYANTMLKNTGVAPKHDVNNKP